MLRFGRGFAEDQVGYSSTTGKKLTNLERSEAFWGDIGRGWGIVLTAAGSARPAKAPSVPRNGLYTLDDFPRIRDALDDMPAMRFGDEAANAGSSACRAPVQKNRELGNAFRDELAELLRSAGRGVRTEVYKRTPFGKRFIDIEVDLDGQVLGGIETKVGRSRYTTAQRAKDWWLSHVEGYPVHVVRKLE